VKVGPVPLDGVPPGADQAKVIGEVPPVADALQLTGLLTAALLQLAVITIGWAVTETDIVCTVNFLLASVTFNVTLKVPFVANVIV